MEHPASLASWEKKEICRGVGLGTVMVSSSSMDQVFTSVFLSSKWEFEWP